jgi:hypothetical protein
MWRTVGRRFAAHGLGGGVSGPRRSVERSQGSVSVARAASLCQWRHRHPDEGTGPNTGSPDGGAYARRYRDREHVNESGHGGLPAGVVPGPGTNRT